MSTGVNRSPSISYVLPLLMTILLSVSCTRDFVYAQALKLTDQTTTPIPGAGHDYISLLAETVNPANGSVTILLSPPTSTGRGPNFPFSFAYNSSQVVHLIDSYVLLNNVSAGWDTTPGFLSSGGWQYAVPSVTNSSWTQAGPIYPNGSFLACYYTTAYMFGDGSGASHDLGIGDVSYEGTVGNECGPNYSYATGVITATDTTVTGILTPGSQAIFDTLRVLDGGGTVYDFGGAQQGRGVSHWQDPKTSTGIFSSLPYRITDRNGNVVNITTDANFYSTGDGQVAVTDATGRSVIRFSGFAASTFSPSSGRTSDTITASGLNYVVTWKAMSAAYSLPNYALPGDAENQCIALPNVSVAQPVISTITLPNNTFYRFLYGDNPDPAFANPFGLLSEIDYPDGGWVKYTWGADSVKYNELAHWTAANSNLPPTPDGCLYRYSAPAVTTRSVGTSPGGSAVLIQQFSYNTLWGASYYWTSKTTSISTQDVIADRTKPTSFTNLSYSPYLASRQVFAHGPIDTQLPVEQSTAYLDGTGSTLRTTSKSWFNQYALRSETNSSNALSSQKTYCYVGTNCAPNTSYGSLILSQLKELDEYDFGATVPTRKTLLTYQPFPAAHGTIANLPCKKVVQDVNGLTAAETDSYYDGGSNLCSSNSGNSLALVSNLLLTTVDPIYSSRILQLRDEANYGSASVIPRGNLTKAVSILNGGTSPVTTYTYDETGKLASMTDPCGNSPCLDMPTSTSHTTIYSFTDNYQGTGGPAGNSNAYLTQITYPSTATTHFQYDWPQGQLIKFTDENGHFTNYQYDALTARLIETDFPDGGSVGITYHDGVYSPGGNIPNATTTQTASPNPSIITIAARDGLGNVIQTQRGAVYVDKSYNGSGLLRTVSNPHGSSPAPTTDGTTTIVYDPLGRETLKTYPNGSSDQWVYSANVTTFTDEGGSQWLRTSDALGRLTNVTEPGILKTGYIYNVLGDLLTVNQYGNGIADTPRTRSFSYDSLSRLVTSFNPETGTVCYGNTPNYAPPNLSNCAEGYDANGNLQSKTDARGIRTSFGYDTVNHLISKSYLNDSSNTPSSCFQYGTSLTGNTVGRLVNEWTQSSVCGASPAADLKSLRTFLAYDSMGRLVWDKRCTGPVECKVQTYRPMTYSYDLAGDSTRSGDGVSNRTFVMQYDSAGRLLDLSSGLPGSASSLFSVQSYGPVGLTGATMGALSVQRLYDNRLRLTGETVVIP